MAQAFAGIRPTDRNLAVDEARAFLTRVYGFMAAGLALTAAASAVVLSSPALMQVLYGTPGVMMVLMVALVGLVVAFSFRLPRASTAEAVGMMVVYALLNGVALSGIFLVYTASSVAGTFVTTAGMFGVMSLIGAITRRDLTGVGSFAMMGVVGIIIASVVNIFVASSGLSFIISVCGVVAFTLLAAFDAQRILQMARAGVVDTKAATRGALSLYLDFINIFLSLLRLTGNRR